MKKIKIFFAIVVLAFYHSAAKAQSVSYAQSLIEQGSYLDAARQLRPLADGGNAEAQVLAAKLFFEGKGVQKNEQQGLKYATMAAKQGNEDAILLLINKSDKIKAFQTAKKYTDEHPSLLKGGIGLFLAECYVSGNGIEKDEIRGWKLFENNFRFEELMRTQKVANAYWNFKMHQAGSNSIMDFADNLYANNKDQYTKLLDYMDLQGFLEPLYLEQIANTGNGWAKAKLAEYYYNKGQKYRAEDLAWQANISGSSYGKNLLQQYVDKSKKFIAAPAEGLTTSINDISGSQHIVKEFLHNKILILYFGANWCKPYQEEIPYMIELYYKYKSQGLEIIGIELDKTKEEWNKAIEELQIPWITLCDFLVFNSPIFKAFGLSSIPSTICLDENGNIIENNVKGKELEFFLKCQLRKKL